jgi:hypothetical protein
VADVAVPLEDLAADPQPGVAVAALVAVAPLLVTLPIVGRLMIGTVRLAAHQSRAAWPSARAERPAYQ